MLLADIHPSFHDDSLDYQHTYLVQPSDLLRAYAPLPLLFHQFLFDSPALTATMSSYDEDFDKLLLYNRNDSVDHAILENDRAGTYSGHSRSTSYCHNQYFCNRHRIGKCDSF